jgi:para-nitrobenzyl esterase
LGAFARLRSHDAEVPMRERPWAVDSPELEVRVSGGIVRGVREGNILAWRGIPYAAAPVGPLRFRAPRPVPSWQEVRDASRFGKAAAQPWRGQFRAVGADLPVSEDCLTLNVLSKDVDSRAPDAGLGLPVMVFIHGGGYSAGSSSDFSGRGEGFVTSGQVVYVSFNYRLGALGYLDFSRYSTPERLFESNLGLRDQVAALEWVRDNITGFGGDPARVTVFGESSGANAVTTLMATPAARGLFARAIAQSSPADSVYSRELADGWAEEFVDALRRIVVAGLRSAEPARLLSEATAAELVTAALVLQLRTPDDIPGTYPLAPVIDGEFVPERPMTAFRTGRAHRVPLIIGTNDREGSIFRGRIDIIPRTLGRIRPLFQRAPATSRERMRDAYPGLPRPRAAADFGGDFAFWFPTVRVAQSHSRFAAVHVYRFDFAPRLMRLVGLDATHGIEMFALFDRTGEPVARTMTALGGRDPFFRAGARMRRNWLRFAVSGTLPEEWPRYSESDRHTLIIDRYDRVEEDPRRERRLAWEAFLPDPD